MTSDLPPLPADLDACHALIGVLLEQLAQLKSLSSEQSETIGSQHEMIQKLEHRIALFQRHLYGQRRERFEDPRQQKLFEIDEELLKEAAKPEEEFEDDSSSPTKRPRRGHGRRRLLKI